MPAPPSGLATPLTGLGLGTPALGATPRSAGTPGEVSPMGTSRAGTPRAASPAAQRPAAATGAGLLAKPSPLSSYPDGVTTPPVAEHSLGISKKVNINPSS